MKWPRILAQFHSRGFWNHYLMVPNMQRARRYRGTFGHAYSKQIRTRSKYTPSQMREKSERQQNLKEKCEHQERIAALGSLSWIKSWVMLVHSGPASGHRNATTSSSRIFYELGLKLASIRTTYTHRPASCRILPCRHYIWNKLKQPSNGEGGWWAYPRETYLPRERRDQGRYREEPPCHPCGAR